MSAPAQSSTNAPRFPAEASISRSPAVAGLLCLSRLWDVLEKDYLSEERKVRILDVDTHTPADIDAFPAGYMVLSSL